MSANLDFKVARLHKLNGVSATKAFADVMINEAVVIKGVRVVEGEKGLFVSMPQEKGSNNQWYDSVRLLTKEARAQIQAVVLEAFSK